MGSYDMTGRNPLSPGATFIYFLPTCIQQGNPFSNTKPSRVYRLKVDNENGEVDQDTVVL